MYLTEYPKITVDNFMGLWDRGSLDDVPPDHATDIRNMAFARKREVLTRPASSFSHFLPDSLPIVRQFDAAFNNNTLIPLVCDGQGAIWRLDNYTVLLKIDGLIDFSAINMNNHVYIAPMIDGSKYNPDTDVIYVWTEPSTYIRKAAGLRPDASQLVVFASGGGNVGPGWYGISISYIFDTGYVSPPSDVQTVFAPGGTSLEVGFPPLPVGAVGYLVLSTKAQDTQQNASTAALFEVLTSYGQGQPVILNFFDTDLVIAATADPVNGNLFNSMARLPTNGGYGSVALIKYHNRMIIIGPDLVYPPNYDPTNPDPTISNPTRVQDGRIFVSAAGAPENFDNETGFIIIQAEFDGNYPRTGFELFSVLYICKPVGTFSTQDNGSEPRDPTNPWVVNLIDGGIGAYHHAVGTITGSQPSLSFNSTAFLANRNGLFIFNGNVLRPELTWKIRAVWQQMTKNLESEIRVTVDIFNDVFYVLIPTDDPRFNPNPGVVNPNFSLNPKVLLVGDYSLGLDSNNIRWSIYSFPYAVYDIMMASMPDPVQPPLGSMSFYYLRMGTLGIMYKLDGFTTADEVWSAVAGSTSAQYLYSVPIDNWYQSAPLITGDIGSLNITRFVRYRMAGQGTLFSTLKDQGEYRMQQIINVSPDPFPGNYRDIGIQTNFTNEKVIVQFRMDGMNDFVRMARFDVFGKARWPTRPNA